MPRGQNAPFSEGNSAMNPPWCWKLLENAFRSVAAITTTLRRYEFHSRIGNLFTNCQHEWHMTYECPHYWFPASHRFLPGWWQQLYWQIFLWTSPLTYKSPHYRFTAFNRFLPTWLIAAAVLTAFSLSSACDIWVPTPPISCFRLSRDVSWKVNYFISFFLALTNCFVGFSFIPGQHGCGMRIRSDLMSIRI